MKQFIITMFGSLFLVAMPVAAAPAMSSGHAGVLKSVEGNVKIIGTYSASSTVRSARSGDSVDSSERIMTGPQSGASLVLRDGTVLVVGPSSRLELRQFQFDSTTQDGNVLLKLLRGSMRMVSGLIGKKNPDAVRIDTETATIGIRGTDFIVSANAQP